MTYVDTSNISAEVFVTVLLFLIIIAPLFSLAILRFFQGKKKAGLLLIAAKRGGLPCFSDRHEIFILNALAF